jgi:uncharacterized protein YdhG (YjbR/CyaY superfamily)
MNMEATTKKFKTVAEYFSAFPPKKRAFLKEMRKIIREAAPQAEEMISYNMPAFKLNGMLVYYAAWKEHIGFYAGVSAIRNLIKETSAYQGGKGTLQFPLSGPLPAGLITKIVKFRAKENLEKTKAKGKK